MLMFDLKEYPGYVLGPLISFLRSFFFFCAGLYPSCFCLNLNFFDSPSLSLAYVSISLTFGPLFSGIF